MIARWMLIAGLGLTALLAGCNEQDIGGNDLSRQVVSYQPDRTVSAENVLSDPWIDWRPFADEALAAGDCSEAFTIAFFAANEDPASVQFVENLVSEDECKVPLAWEQQMMLQIMALTDPFSREPGISFRWADETAGRVPQFKLTRDPDRPEVKIILEVPISGEIRALEAEWISHCEDPMGLATTRPYNLRLHLSLSRRDESFLISDWEERRQECLTLLRNIREGYFAMINQDEQGNVALQQLVEDLDAMIFIESINLPTDDQSP